MGDWTYTRITTKPTEVSDEYLGVMESAPGGSHVVGDSYVDSETLKIQVWNGAQWVPLSQSGLSDAKKSEIAGKAQKDVLSRIEPGTVTDSEYGYFNAIIAGTVNADFISGIEGEFENLRIGGNSIFKGNIVCPSFSSLPKTPTSVITIAMSGDAKTQFNQLLNSGVSTDLQPCTHSASPSVAYMKRVSSSSTGSLWEFYSKTMSVVGSIRASYGSWGSSYSSTWDGTSYTLTVGTSSSVVFKLNGLGTTYSSLETGELFYTIDSNGATGTLHIKL